MELGSTVPTILLGSTSCSQHFAGLNGTGLRSFQYFAGLNGTGPHFSQYFAGQKGPAFAGLNGTGLHYSQYFAGPGFHISVQHFRIDLGYIFLLSSP